MVLILHAVYSYIVKFLYGRYVGEFDEDINYARSIQKNS
jgi:hypothetical protein